jgi:hypothetical protein
MPSQYYSAAILIKQTRVRSYTVPQARPSRKRRERVRPRIVTETRTPGAPANRFPRCGRTRHASPKENFKCRNIRPDERVSFVFALATCRRKRIQPTLRLPVCLAHRTKSATTNSGEKFRHSGQLGHVSTSARVRLSRGIASRALLNGDRAAIWRFDSADAIYNVHLNAGFEGTAYRIGNAGYRSGREKHLMKRKPNAGSGFTEARPEFMREKQNTEFRQRTNRWHAVA